MKDKKVSIYKLIDPRDNSIKYIGKSCNIDSRLACHLSESRKEGKKNRRCAWIKSLLNLGLKPIIEEIEVCENNRVASERERYYIGFYKDLDLKNDQPGGDGQPPGYEFKGRYTPPKGEYPKNFIGLDRSTYKKAKPYERRKGYSVPALRKTILVYDILDKNETVYDSLKSASQATGVRIGDISDRCRGRIKSPAKNRYNFSFEKDGINKEDRHHGIYIIRIKDDIEEEFNSILEASKKCNIKRDTIYKYLDTEKADKNGYRWKRKTDSTES